jgi:hypothetical protein
VDAEADASLWVAAVSAMFLEPEARISWLANAGTSSGKFCDDGGSEAAEVGASCWAPARSELDSWGEAKVSVGVTAGSPSMGVGEAMASCWAVAGSVSLLEVVGSVGTPSEIDETPSGAVHSGPREIVEAMSGSSWSKFIDECWNRSGQWGGGCENT